MALPVDVPLLSSSRFSTAPFFAAVGYVLFGLVAAALVAFVLVKVLRRRGVVRYWRIALKTSVVVFLLITSWAWVTSKHYTVVRVTADAVELRFANWPWPAQRFTFDEIESVSLSTSTRRGRAVGHGLVIMTKPTSLFASTYWPSAPAEREHVIPAIQWVEHASGGRLTRSARARDMLTSTPQR
ncbi:MAG: hypothetical protein FJZ38_07405 [Candidatus Rokubacteria bacterium]|nr:hypothetical protein [Candidatus Rokubacteria bacterium]